MKIKYSIVFFFIFCSGIYISCSQNSISNSEKKYIMHYFLGEKYKALEEYEKAKIEYGICINENPREAAAFFQLAKINFMLGDYSLAEEYIIQAKKINPKNIWYLYLLIDVYSQTYRLEEQAEVWLDLIQIDKQNPIYYIEAIYAYTNLGLFKKALKIIKKAEINISSNETIVLLKSEIFQKEGNIPKAIEILLSAHQKEPKNLNFLKELSELYILQSEYDLANKTYNKILSLEPENSTALLASYKIYQTQGLTQMEIEVFLKIFASSEITKEQKIDVLFDIFSDNKKIERYNNYIPKVLVDCIFTYPDELMFYVVLGDFKLLSNDFEAALTNYISAINYGLKDKVIYEKVININLVNDELDEVLLYSKQAIDYFPFHPIFYYYRGLAFMYKEDYEYAIKIIQQGLEYVIDEPLLKSEMYAFLGDIYHKLGNNEESDKNYDLALQINPEYIIVLNNYSYYLSLRGGEKNLLMAEGMIIKCLELTEDSPRSSFLDTYAWILFQQGNESKDLNTQLEKYNLSKKIMILCFENGGDSAVMHDHYGDILFKLNDIIGAKKQWKEAIEKDPENKELLKKLNKF